MYLIPTLSTLPFVLATAIATPAIAIPPSDVSNKLDTIIVFAPVDASADTPKPLTFKLEGKTRSVYFAAFSPAAVQQIINERLVPQKLKNAKNIKFAPFSLSKFDSLVQPQLKKKGDSRVVYVPDPIQVPFSEKLLISQGSSPKDAKTVSTRFPSVFCPSPSIKATPNKGPLKGQSFVPCSTDYTSVKKLVDKGIASNPKVKSTKPKVIAIPLPNFASVLVKSSKEAVGDLRILPNPANIKALKMLSN